jgi:hypothetical protein
LEGTEFMLNRRIALPAMIVATLAVAGCRPLSPVNNISNASYGDSIYASTNVLSLDDYERAIVRAGSNRGWQFTRVAPGQLRGTVDVRGKHQASVDVTFTTQTYSINYAGSENLKYDAATNSIHPSYNSWVKLLDGEIQAEIQRLQAS